MRCRSAAAKQHRSNIAPRSPPNTANICPGWAKDPNGPSDRRRQVGPEAGFRWATGTGHSWRHPECPCGGGWAVFHGAGVGISRLGTLPTPMFGGLLLSRASGSTFARRSDFGPKSVDLADNGQLWQVWANSSPARSNSAMPPPRPPPRARHVLSAPPWDAARHPREGRQARYARISLWRARRHNAAASLPARRVSGVQAILAEVWLDIGQVWAKSAGCRRAEGRVWPIPRRPGEAREGSGGGRPTLKRGRREAGPIQASAAQRSMRSRTHAARGTVATGCRAQSPWLKPSSESPPAPRAPSRPHSGRPSALGGPDRPSHGAHRLQVAKGPGRASGGALRRPRPRHAGGAREPTPRPPLRRRAYTPPQPHGRGARRKDEVLGAQLNGWRPAGKAPAPDARRAAREVPAGRIPGGTSTATRGVAAPPRSRLADAESQRQQRAVARPSPLLAAGRQRPDLGLFLFLAASCVMCTRQRVVDLPGAVWLRRHSAQRASRLRRRGPARPAPQTWGPGKVAGPRVGHLVGAVPGRRGPLAAGRRNPPPDCDATRSGAATAHGRRRTRPMGPRNGHQVVDTRVQRNKDMTPTSSEVGTRRPWRQNQSTG